MRRALGLDLDGTLFSCRARQVALAAHVAGPLDEQRFWSAKRDGATTAAALAAQDIADARAAAAAWAAAIEDDRWLELDDVAEGAHEALERVRDAGLATVVLTARRDPGAVRRQIARSALAPLVDQVHVVDPRAAADEKAALLRAPQFIAMVGDTESDARAAQLAGVPFAAVGTGQRSPAFLRAHGLRTVHRDVAEAVGALLQMTVPQPI